MLDGLETLLTAFEPTSSPQRDYQRRMLELLQWGQDSIHRKHFEPGHFTTSAFVLTPDRSALLLILHKKLGRWLQPGGHIEASDANPQASALREVIEETGLEAQNLVSLHSGIFDLDIHPIPAHGDEPGHRHFDLRFLFGLKEDVEVKVQSEVDGIGFWPLTGIRTRCEDSSIIRVATAILGQQGMDETEVVK